MKKSKKKIKIMSTVSKELTGIEIAKYLLSIGSYKEPDQINSLQDKVRRDETSKEKRKHY
jgi:hypothetical protein